MTATDRIRDLLVHLHDSVPPSDVTSKIVAVGAAVVAGEPAEHVADLALQAGEGLAASLPQGEDLAEGLHRLADAAEGLPGDAAARLRDLALMSGPPAGPGSCAEARLRLLLEARRCLGRAARGMH